MNSYTQGLSRAEIERQITQLEVQLANCKDADNREATEKHLAALRETLPFQSFFDELAETN